jgi:hypothetical protein
LALADTVIVGKSRLEWLTKSCPVAEAVDTSVRTAANNILPMEILVNIFSRLDAISLARASQVCRTWQRVPWLILDLGRAVADVRWFKVNLDRACCAGCFLSDSFNFLSSYSQAL